MPRDFDTWNTRENFLSQNPRKAFQERFLLVYLVFTCHWRQICYTQLSKPSTKLRSWAPLLVYDATVQVTNVFLSDDYRIKDPPSNQIPTILLQIQLAEFRKVHYKGGMSLCYQILSQQNDLTSKYLNALLDIIFEITSSRSY